MLNTPTTFPNTGSYARAKGLPGTVRIQQINDDGTRLITGPKVSARRVPLADLSAARAPRAS